MSEDTLNNQNNEPDAMDKEDDGENIAEVFEGLINAARLDILEEVRAMLEGQGNHQSVDAVNEPNDEVAALKQQLQAAQREADEERIENAFIAACNASQLHSELTLAYAKTNGKVEVKNRQVYVDGKPVASYVQGLAKSPLGRNLSVAPSKGVDVKRTSGPSTSGPQTAADIFGQLFS